MHRSFVATWFTPLFAIWGIDAFVSIVILAPAASEEADLELRALIKKLPDHLVMQADFCGNAAPVTLKDLYSAENQITKELLKMVRAATSNGLKNPNETLEEEKARIRN
jgi:hypothetical protein